MARSGTQEPFLLSFEHLKVKLLVYVLFAWPDKTLRLIMNLI